MFIFDMLLRLFTLVGMHGTLLATKEKSGRGIALLGMAIGLGVLTKGPVILLHVLPVALLAPWWHPGLRWSRWFGGVLVAVPIGSAMALTRAVPAGLAGGQKYRSAIFWGQTAERMVKSFAHRRPAWWYLPHLPLMLFPWLADHPQGHAVIYANVFRGQKQSSCNPIAAVPWRSLMRRRPCHF